MKHPLDSEPGDLFLVVVQATRNSPPTPRNVPILGVSPNCEDALELLGRSLGPAWPTGHVVCITPEGDIFAWRRQEWLGRPDTTTKEDWRRLARGDLVPRLEVVAAAYRVYQAALVQQGE